MQTIGFIGVGHMGSALAAAVCKVVDPSMVLVSDMPERAAAVAAELGCRAADNATIAAQCDCLFLGVKPQTLPELLPTIAVALRQNPDRLIVSMAAGVSIATLEAQLGNLPIIRMMPNLPVTVGAGLIVYAANDAVTAVQKQSFCTWLSAAGKLEELEESHMDAAGAVSGCGPAFVSMFADALANGGAACGLPPEKALLYALQTLCGTAELLCATGEQPADLTKAVCSPGGTTIEGVHVLEARSFTEIAADAVKASYARTLELSKG